MEPSVEIIYSRRRSLCLQVTRDGKIRVRAPYHTPDTVIRAFLKEKSAWLSRQLASLPAPGEPEALPFTEQELNRLHREARKDLLPRIDAYAARLGVSFGRVSIRAQKTRWGSCSSEGNLNFNCLLILLPPEIRDYVVVHELCHRMEMNHSPRFWALVEQVLPDYRERKRLLRELGAPLIRRIP